MSHCWHSCRSWVKALENSRQECPSPPPLQSPVNSPQLSMSPSLSEAVASSFDLEGASASKETKGNVTSMACLVAIK